MMVRPSSFHAPGLDKKTDAAIRRILYRWSKSDASKEAKSKNKKAK